MYKDYEELYKKYNDPIVVYARKNQNPFDDLSDPFSSSSDPFGSPNSYDGGFGSYSSGDSFGEPSTFSFEDDLSMPNKARSKSKNKSRNNRNRRNNRKNNNVGKKVVIAIAGVAVVAVMTVSGWKLLADKNLPEVESSTIQAELETYGGSREIEGVQVEYDDEQGTDSSSALDSLQQEYGDVDTVADTEEEIALKEKYESLQAAYEEAGFENWEIAKLLDSETIFDGTESDIDFYYDSATGEVIYVYDELEREEEATNTGEIAISENVQKIIDAINGNENLSEEEKQYIIDTYTSTWVNNEQYLNLDILIQRYANLKIEYDYTEGGKVEEQSSSNPATNIAGQYASIDNAVLTPTSRITIFVAENIAQAKEDEQASSALDHEINHINGNFGGINGGSIKTTMLNEGYTQLSSASESKSYSNGQAMAILYAETFGTEALKEGYYGMNLENVLTNNIVQATGRDSVEVNQEIANLLSETQDILYQMDADENCRSDTELMSRLESLINQLSSYSEIINGYSLEQNQTSLLMQDYLTGEHKSQLYSDEEKIDSFSYDVDTGKIDVTISKAYENVKVNNSAYSYSLLTGTHTRHITLDDSNKYDADLTRDGTITDDSIDYTTR